MREQIERAAEALHDRARRAQDAAPRVRYATLESVDPIRAVLADTSMELEDDDLVLGQWAVFYEQQFGMAAGDTLVVVRVDDDFVVLDVISDTTMALP